MQPTINARARELNLVHKGGQNRPPNVMPFNFSASPATAALPLRGAKGKAAANGKARQPRPLPGLAPRPLALAASPVKHSPVSKSPVSKHVAGTGDGKRRCVDRRPKPLAEVTAKVADAGSSADADQLALILALRTELYELHRRNETPASLHDLVHAEAAELILRIRAEQSRGVASVAQPTGLDAWGVPHSGAAASGFDADFQDGGNFDVDFAEAENTELHRFSISDSFVGGEPLDPATIPWTPRGPGIGMGGFHFT